MEFEPGQPQFGEGVLHDFGRVAAIRVHAPKTDKAFGRAVDDPSNLLV